MILEMNRKALYFLMFFFLVISSFFIIKKLQKKAPPVINLSGLVLKDLNGNLINLNKFNGKPLIINYWATWCGPCREEFPIFEKVYKKYGNQINFLMVSAEPIDKIIQYKNSNNYSLQFGQLQKQLNQLAITSIPVTAIYTAEGKLLTTKTIPLTELLLLEIVADLIKKK